jgi:hypothetical protein
LLCVCNIQHHKKKKKKKKNRYVLLSLSIDSDARISFCSSSSSNILPYFLIHFIC